MAVIRECLTCKKEFKTKLFYLRAGQGMYCSRECGYAAHRTGKMVSCATCGESVYRKPRLLRISKSKKHFCGKKCQTAWRNQLFVGRAHANWVHGRASYRSVLDRIKRAVRCELCGTVDRRVLAVHHKDRVRTNNEPENLAWLCHNCHFLVHHYDMGRDRGLLTKRS